MLGVKCREKGARDAGLKIVAETIGFYCHREGWFHHPLNGGHTVFFQLEINPQNKQSNVKIIQCKINSYVELN